METLADWIQTRGPLSANDAVGWAIRLAKHVESLHEHGVAHGNVSPACILLGALDPRTPGYMSDVRKTTESLPFHSPERVRSGQLSPADDTWAIAATLYTALTAAPPFVGASDAEIRKQVLKGPPAPLSVYGIDDDRLERLLAQTFAYEASRRLSNTALLRRELEKIHPAPLGLLALEDEEVGDEDQAATAMVSLSQDAMQGIFAPASVQGGGADTTPPPGDPAAPTGGDATVMRELPAHIMKMAARAAAGSNPPPAPEKPAPLPAALAAPPPRPSAPRPPTPPGAPKAPVAPQMPAPIGSRPQQQPWDADSDSGDMATRVGPSPASAIAALRAPAAGPAPAPRPSSPGSSPRPSGPGSAPRPGFAAPSPDAAPPPPSSGPSSDDDVRTIMHQGDVGALIRGAAGTPIGSAAQPKPGFAPPTSPSAPRGPQPGFPAPAPQSGGGGAVPAPRPAPQPPLGDDDEDDGARTVLRESPLLTAEMLSRAGISVPNAPAAPAPAPNRWQPAAPPAQPPQPAYGQLPPAAPPPRPSNPVTGPSAPFRPGPTEVSGATPMQMPKEPSGSFPSPAPGAFPSPHEPSQPSFSPFSPAPPLGGAHGARPAVSALIQEALAELPNPGSPSGGGYSPGPGGFPGNSVESASQLGMANLAGVIGGQAPGYPLGAGLPTDASAAAPAAEPQAKKGGYGSLVLTCVFVLLFAAAGTFAALKYRAKLGLDFLNSIAPAPSAAAAPPGGAADPPPGGSAAKK